MRAIDTNVLVRLLARDDETQSAAAEAFIASEGGWVSQIVLVEAIWVLASVYELKPAKLAAAVHMLLDHKQLILQEQETVAAALATFRRHPAVGFSDCLILEQARKQGHLPLGTFDRQLSKADGAQLLRSA